MRYAETTVLLCHCVHFKIDLISISLSCRIRTIKSFKLFGRQVIRISSIVFSLHKLGIEITQIEVKVASTFFTQK